MLIRKRSVITKEWHTMDLPITQERVDAWVKSRQLVQIAFPELTPSQREFLISGATDEEWQKAFGDENTIDTAALVAVAAAKSKGVP